MRDAVADAAATASQDAQPDAGMRDAAADAGAAASPNAQLRDAGMQDAVAVAAAAYLQLRDAPPCSSRAAPRSRRP